MDNDVKMAGELYDMLTAEERRFVLDLLRVLSSSQASVDDSPDSEKQTNG